MINVLEINKNQTRVKVSNASAMSLLSYAVKI